MDDRISGAAATAEACYDGEDESATRTFVRLLRFSLTELPEFPGDLANITLPHRRQMPPPPLRQ